MDHVWQNYHANKFTTASHWCSITKKSVSLCHKYFVGGERVKKYKHRSSLSGDPFDEGRLFFPTKTKEEAVQERLRYLADSWADVKTPSGIIVQHVACSGSLIWIVDSNNHFLYSSSTSQNYSWKKCDGRGTHIATNQVGTVVWSIDRNNTCHVRTGVKESCPQGILLGISCPKFIRNVFIFICSETIAHI